MSRGLGRGTGCDLDRRCRRQIRGEGHLARDEDEPDVGAGKVQHRPGRGVEQLDVGRAVEHAGHQIGELSEAVLPPVDLPDHHALVDRAEHRARVVARPPQRAGRGGAHLHGLHEADVERDGERLPDARDDPVEAHRLVEARHEECELVAPDRRGEACGDDLRQAAGRPPGAAGRRPRGRAGR